MSHCQNRNKEDLFRMLRRSNGTEFDEKIIKSWYKARKYVLKALGEHDVFDNIINRKQQVHVVLEGTSELMMSVARQIAFLVHYPTFDDVTGKNRTVITILFDNKSMETGSIIDLVSKEEYLCKLPQYCKCTVWNYGEETKKKVLHENSFLDIELELIDFNGTDFNKYESVDALRIKESYIQDDSFDEVIDISMAKRVNMVYNVGADIDNLPPDNPNTAERYDRALLYFCYQQSPNDTQKAWDAFGDEQIEIKNKLSNVFCSDCFPSRLKYIINKNKKDEDKTVDSISLSKYMVAKYQKVLSLLKDNLKSLAMCEHARWNVEKLLLGFRPLSEKEHLEDEQLFGRDRAAYRKSLKNQGIHIDLCSYRDLRRINPGDMKYDSFLMVAMPRIMVEMDSSTKIM